MPPKPGPAKINVSLMPDADLRPWTKDDAFDHLVLQEAHSLDKAISITSPHKIAGTRGDSELDVKPEEWYEFQKIQTEKKTMMLSMKQLGSKTGSRSGSKINTPKSSTPGLEVSPHVSNQVSRQASGTGTPMSGPEHNEEIEVDDDDNDDARYIIKMRKKLKSQHDAHMHRSKPMKAIDYEGRRCPAVLNVSTKDYEALQSRYPAAAAPPPRK